MAAVQLPSLSRKLQYLYAHSGLKQKALAEALGYKESTVSGWVNGTKTTSPGQVSQDGLAKLSAILVKLFGSVADVAAARKLWLGTEAEFARALHFSPHFADLLAMAERRKMLTYLSGAAAGERLVTFFELSETSCGAEGAEVAERFASAAVDECFAFNLAAEPNAQIVLLVESAVGCHLGVPGPGAPSRLDSSGSARLPDFPGLYRFAEPKGLHRFVVFAIDADAPLSIATCVGQQRPLRESDLDMFAAELCDKQRVRSWVLDALLVDVR